MKRVLRDSELRDMTPDEQRQAFVELVRSSRGPASGALEELNDQLRRFEAAHGIDSETMRRDVERGVRQETLEICDWLMAMKQREYIERARHALDLARRGPEFVPRG